MELHTITTAMSSHELIFDLPAAFIEFAKSPIQHSAEVRLVAILIPKRS